ncbi:MAG: hypothetical protein RL681_253 [Candidatus Parcubacteria bacterium]|jgi:uncharacterized protein (TIGR04222 family)
MRKFGALIALAAALIAASSYSFAFAQGNSPATGLMAANAQEGEGWIIPSFMSDITVRPDGRVAVQETIGVDFLNLQKHGIVRDIPYAYSEADGSTSYTVVTVTDVLQDGSPATVQTTRNDNNLRMQIGDPNRTIFGAHTYVIRYTVSGILRSFASYDELYWNVTGNGWLVPILLSSARITVPQASSSPGKIGNMQASCYVGPRGSTRPCSTSDTQENEGYFVQKEPLDPGAGLTVALGFPKGIVPILKADKFEAAGASPLGAAVMLLTAAFVFVLGVFFITRRWWRLGRDHWYKRTPATRIGAGPAQGGGDGTGATEETMPLGAHETIIAEYDPPNSLRPAELGVLRDEKADTIDVSATIVDLAVRGYLEITELPKSGIFGATDYELKRLKTMDDKLMPYERTLFDGLMNIGNGDAVRVSELKEKFHTTLNKVQSMLYEHMTKEGYFTVNPVSARMRHAVVAALLVGVGVIGAVWTANAKLLFPTLLHAAGAGALTSCLALGVVLFVVALRAMPQRTAKGREVYRKLRGYELYLKSVEQYRQQFFEREGTFMQVLPYVIMLGLTTRIAAAMAAMGMHPQAPAWYHSASSDAFSISAFSGSLDSFSNSLGTTMASAPHGSGSGGGGFSGGGGGGGGGGSW